jgi:hypothetical protein
MMRNTFLPDQRAYYPDLEICELSELAAEGLVEMFDPATQLFCFRLKRSKGGLVREGSSRRYTIMSLLGLHQLETAGIRSKIGIKSSFDNLLRTTDQITDLGDLGLFLWLCALVSPQDLEHLFSKIDLNNALNNHPVAKAGRTMELAWFLSGLAHTTLVSGHSPRDMADVAMKTYQLIKDNQGNKGIFGHLGKSRSFSGLLRGRIGSFADQVYPIYAFSKFAQAYDVPKALQSATSCAEAICRAQGQLGQWWWHYDSLTGNVVEEYPVYSVHQHGMAPMALLALEAASRCDFTPAISKGLQWIFGNNELGRDFRDTSAHVIWRSAYPKAHRRHLGTVVRILTGRNNVHSSKDMKVKFECRPYELGWLLYAWAGRGEAARTA